MLELCSLEAEVCEVGAREMPGFELGSLGGGWTLLMLFSTVGGMLQLDAGKGALEAIVTGGPPEGSWTFLLSAAASAMSLFC